MSNKKTSKASFSMQFKRKQSGDFMVSLSVALIIVAIISAGVFIAFNSNTRKNEIKETTNAVISTAANLRQNFGINNTYGSVTTAIAVQSRTIPAEQRISGTNTAANAYGGAITIASNTLTATDDVAELTYNQIPSSQCVDIVLGSVAAGRKITVAGVTVKATDSAINIATLAGACENASNVAVVWSVGRTGT